MFTISKEILSPILADFGISAQIADFTELQRYHYEKEDPASKEVRLIVKVQLADGRALVARFKNEADVTRELVDAQSRFARLLAAHQRGNPRRLQLPRAIRPLVRHQWIRCDRNGGGLRVRRAARRYPGNCRKNRRPARAHAQHRGKRPVPRAKTASCSIHWAKTTCSALRFSPRKKRPYRPWTRRFTRTLPASASALCRKSVRGKAGPNTPCRAISAIAICIKPRAGALACSISTAAATPCSTTTP